MSVGMRSAVLAKPRHPCNIRETSRVLGSAQRVGREQRRPLCKSAPNDQFGEEAPGTGRRQFPALQQSASEGDDDEHFDKRSAAEMYELFEELQRRQGTGGLPADLNDIDVEKLTAQLDDSRHTDYGPGAGKKRRPSAVSPRSEEEAPNQFQMMSTAEVVALWEKMQQGQGTGEAGDQ